jgi:hypothetical protein
VQIPLTFEEDLEANLDYTATKFTFKRFCTYKKRLLAVPREVTRKDSKESKVILPLRKKSKKRLQKTKEQKGAKSAAKRTCQVADVDDFQSVHVPIRSNTTAPFVCFCDAVAASMAKLQAQLDDVSDKERDGGSTRK